MQTYKIFIHGSTGWQSNWITKIRFRKPQPRWWLKFSYNNDHLTKWNMCNTAISCYKHTYECHFKSQSLWILKQEAHTNEMFSLSLIDLFAEHKCKQTNQLVSRQKNTHCTYHTTWLQNTITGKNIKHNLTCKVNKHIHNNVIT